MENLEQWDDDDPFTPEVIAEHERRALAHWERTHRLGGRRAIFKWRLEIFIRRVVSKVGDVRTAIIMAHQRWRDPWIYEAIKDKENGRYHWVYEALRDAEENARKSRGK